MSGLDGCSNVSLLVINLLEICAVHIRFAHEMWNAILFWFSFGLDSLAYIVIPKNNDKNKFKK